MSEKRAEKRIFGAGLSSIEIGTVVAVNPVSNSVRVAFDNLGVMRDAIMVAPFISARVGVRCNFVPSVNTRVLVLLPENGKAFVIAGLSPDLPDPAGTEARFIEPTSQGRHKRPLYQSRPGVLNNVSDPPRDLLEGELEIGSALTGVLQLLMGMAKLGAGDRARVETHLIDDLVRIVCGAYQHVSAFGDLSVYNDGRINVEFNGSSYPHEVDGAKTTEDKRFPFTNAGVVDFSKIDQVAEEGRWRFSLLLGHLGDFVRMLVTDPTESVGKLASDALRAGRFQAHVGSSGSLLVQSTSEISIEHVSKILVPVRLKRWQDSAGVRAEDYKTLDKKFLKQWVDGDGASPSERAYKLRLYARWFSEYLSLARVHQMAEGERAEWKVPSETEQPEPSRTVREADRVESAERQVYYVKSYACRRILQDGSIVDFSHHGHAVHMDERGIRLTSANEITLEAAGNINMIAGQSIHMRARRSLQLTADLGGVQIWGRKWLRLFCKNGTLLLKSAGRREWGATDPRKPDPDPDAEVDERQDLPKRQLVRGRGIVIDSQESGIGVTANGQIHMVTTGSDVGRRRDIVISPQTNLQLNAAQLDLQARSMTIRRFRDLLVKARGVLVSVDDVFDVNKMFSVVGDGAHFKQLTVRVLRTLTTIFSTRETCAVWTPDEDQLRTLDKLPDQDKVTSYIKLPTSTDEDSLNDEDDAGEVIKRDVAFETFRADPGLPWYSGLDALFPDYLESLDPPAVSRTGLFISSDGFMDNDAYMGKADSGVHSFYYESLSQQFARHDFVDDPANADNPLYKEWAWRELDAWPGKNAIFVLIGKKTDTNVEIPALSGSSTMAPKDYPTSLAGTQSDESTFRFRSLDTPAKRTTSP